MHRPKLKEQEPHGTARLPLRVHEFTSDPLRLERVPPHWHPECELLVVTRGGAALHVDGQTQALTVGDIAVLMPDQLHAMTAPVGTAFAFYAVVFDPVFLHSAVPDAVQQYFDQVAAGAVVLPTRLAPTSAQYAPLRAALDTMRRVAEPLAAPGELVLKAQLYLAWAALWSAASTPVAAGGGATARVDLIKAVIATIRTHYAEPLSLADLATRFNLSKSHLCRVFKATTKATLTDYLNETRLNQAAHLLRTTDRPIGDIAGAVGFNNISYFNKRFLHHQHVTPSQYRAARR